MRTSTAELRFRAMGSDVHIVVAAGGSLSGPHARVLARRGQRRLLQLERRWSRFLHDSEVRRLADEAGRWMPVSADTSLLVQRMLDAWELTDGWFDPTVLGCLRGLGYDRSFERIPPVVREHRLLPAPGLEGVQVDAAAGLVRLPKGTELDPGGIGKGLAADIVSQDLRHSGAAGACVNVGGDVRVRGEPGDGDEWCVAVPACDESHPVLAVQDAGVATSSPERRRWRTHVGVRHHLLDPRAGEPRDGGLTSLTVVAPTGWQAEALATAGAVAGWTAAERLAARLRSHALASTCEGRRLATPGLRGLVA